MLKNIFLMNLFYISYVSSSIPYSSVSIPTMHPLILLLTGKRLINLSLDFRFL